METCHYYGTNEMSLVRVSISPFLMVMCIYEVMTFLHHFDVDVNERGRVSCFIVLQEELIQPPPLSHLQPSHSATYTCSYLSNAVANSI